jgi:hypothetical protein
MPGSKLLQGEVVLTHRWFFIGGFGWKLRFCWTQNDSLLVNVRPIVASAKTAKLEILSDIGIEFCIVGV